MGELSKNRGPSDREDASYRPDIRSAAKDETYARMYRALKREADHSGRYPLRTHVDAVDYSTESAEDFPETLKYDSAVSSFKTEKIFDTYAEYKRGRNR
jgi:phytoene dehydrogenase-like protein